MTEDDGLTRVVSGRVKWFDPVKGFGFIVADDEAQDILLHANILRNFGQSSIADGAGITVRVQSTQRGVQAVEVLKVEAPANAPFPLGEEAILQSQEDLSLLPAEPARIKWFDKGKGFGFANVFGRPEDVFVHIEVLRHSGFADLAAGEAIALRIVEGKRGRMAVQVLAWDASLRA
jgi:cold shock protein